jgi:hypothetical protein
VIIINPKARRRELRAQLKAQQSESPEIVGGKHSKKEKVSQKVIKSGYTVETNDDITNFRFLSLIPIF